MTARKRIFDSSAGWPSLKKGLNHPVQVLEVAFRFRPYKQKRHYRIQCLSTDVVEFSRP